MIYFLVTAQVQRGKMEEWIKLYEEHFLAASEKHGQRLVGAWRTSVGTFDEITDLYVFESLAEFEKVRKALSNDPEVRKYRQEIWAITGHEVSKIIEPLTYSKMK